MDPKWLAALPIAALVALWGVVLILRLVVLVMATAWMVSTLVTAAWHALLNAWHEKFKPHQAPPKPIGA